MDPTQPPSGADDSTNQRPQGQPWGDAYSPYDALLKENAKAYPLVIDSLRRSDRHRLRCWQQFIDPTDLQAIELLLDFLISASNLLKKNEGTSALIFIPERIADDVRVSLDGLLSGYLQIPSDAMRDIMETEFLIRDFALDPEQINVWRNADENVLRRKFRPVHLRQRQASALGVPITEVHGATDYGTHSRLLHVGPPLLFSRSPQLGHEAVHVLDSLNEIVGHGISIVEALAALFSAIEVSAPDSKATLVALKSSFEDIKRARNATAGIGRAIKDRFSASDYGQILILETGLIIAMAEDNSSADFFHTIDPIDFRHFHREVSAKGMRTFTLASLGSGEARAPWDNP